MTPFFKKFLGINWFLVINMYFLLIMGVLAIESAGWNKEEQVIATAFERQMLFIGLGTLVFFATCLIDYRWVSWGGLPLYVVGLALSAFALLQGEDVYGHQSWVRIAGVAFQPSQLAIAGGIIVTSLILGQQGGRFPMLRNPFVKLALVGLACGIPFAVVLLQGDFGSAMVWLPVAAALLFVGNIPLRYMITVTLLGLMIIPWGYYFGLKTHQKERITVYADMLAGKAVDTQGSAYAASYIEKAVGSGGPIGKGRMNEKTINN
ncbi:MAG: FtsW/RodA/SpoVE family cell cycle protein, partial [Verrucomicrobiota bacterium]